MTNTRQDLTTDEHEGIAWRVSQHSSDTGRHCVEVGPLNDGTGRVAVRHSQHPEASLIVYTEAEWQAFTAGVRDGEFDF